MNETTGKNFYRITCVLIVLLVVAIRLHLANVPFERDEGEYAYAGQLLLKGVPPYQEVYNMKFPGVYFMYALSFKMFGESVAAPRYFILLAQLVGACFIFLLARRVINPLAGWVGAAFFLLFNLTLAFQGTQTNTEHFVVAFLVPSLFFLYKGVEEEWLPGLVISGLLLATACLMKQHAFIFVLATVPWVLYIRKTKSLNYLFAYAAGGILPVVLMAFYLWHAGVWYRFYFLTIQYAREYIGVVPVHKGVRPVKFQQSLISQLSPVLIWFTIVGIVGLLLPTIKRKEKLFLLLLFVASAVVVCPGFYFRRHYFLMTLPLFSLLFANAAFLLTGYFNLQRRYLMLVFFVIANAAFFVGYHFNSFFVESPKQLSEEMYPGSPFAVSGEVASYIQRHTKPNDRVCMVGVEPQLFFLSQRRSASGYIYIYPLLEKQKFNGMMNDEFIAQSEACKPAMLVYTSVSVFDDNYTQHERLLGWFNDFKKNYRLVGLYTPQADNERFTVFDTITPMDTLPLRAPQIKIYQRVEQ